MTYKTELMYKVANLYYLNEFKQETIGRKLKISKYKVNRMLKKAKEEGMIQIRVVKPNNNN